MKKIYLYMIFFLLISSCKFNLDNPELSPESLTITLDKTVYHIDEPLTLVIQNGSNEDLILGNCSTNPGFDIVKLTHSQWEIPYYLDCAAIGEPFEIKRGQVFVRSINLPVFANQLDKVEGKYKLRLWLYKKSEAAERKYLPDSLRTTSVFELVK